MYLHVYTSTIFSFLCDEGRRRIAPGSWIRTGRLSVCPTITQYTVVRWLWMVDLQNRCGPRGACFHHNTPHALYYVYILYIYHYHHISYIYIYH